MPATQKPKPFTFEDLAGKTHPLPFASEVHDKLSGQDLHDAIIGNQMSVYLFKLMDAAELKEPVRKALLAMPQTRVLSILDEWVEYGDGDGASLGESAGSST